MTESGRFLPRTAEVRFSLVRFGRRLWTRERARDIHVKLLQQLSLLPAGGTIVIDAKGVQVFDYSFANELFGRTLLALPREFPGRFVIVENLTTYTRENLDKALESLGLAMIERAGGTLHLLGKVHRVDEETFSVIQHQGGPVTASELTRALGLNPTAINERLSKLVSLALVGREKATSPAGREQYVYWAPA